MFIVIIFVGLLAIGGIGYLIGEPTPTPETIQATYHGIARTSLQGHPKPEIRYFIGAVAIFRVMVEGEEGATWEEIEELAVGTIPPTTAKNRTLRKQVRVLVESMETKAKYLAKARGTTREDPEIKRIVLEAALTGLTNGAKEALKSNKGKVPGMESAR